MQTLVVDFIRSRVGTECTPASTQLYLTVAHKLFDDIEEEKAAQRAQRNKVASSAAARERPRPPAPVPVVNVRPDPDDDVDDKSS